MNDDTRLQLELINKTLPELQMRNRQARIKPAIWWDTLDWKGIFEEVDIGIGLV